MQFAHPQPRLQLPLSPHQTRHQLPIHCPPLSLAPPRIIVLPAHPQPPTHPLPVDSALFPILFYRPVPRCPPAFFLTSSTSLIPARSQARRVYCRSSANSRFASASASSNARTRRF